MAVYFLLLIKNWINIVMSHLSQDSFFLRFLSMLFFKQIKNKTKKNKNIYKTSMT